MKIDKIAGPAFLERSISELNQRMKLRSVSYLKRACEVAYWLVVIEEREEAQKIFDAFAEQGYQDKASLWRPLERIHALAAVMNDKQEAFADEVAAVIAKSAEEKAFHERRMAETSLDPISFVDGDLRAEVTARLERVMALLTLHALGGGALGCENTLVLCEEQSIRLREISKGAGVQL